MRTIKVKVYKFDELSDDAKQRAMDKYCYTDTYAWGDDAMNSLKKFLEHFDCDLKDWQIDFMEPHRNDIRIVYPELEEDEIHERIEALGKYNPETLKGTGECKLTGYCEDESLADGIRIAWHRGERDLQELIECGIAEWEKSVKSDCEYQFSQEAYAEFCDINGYEFTEDGSMV